MLALVLVIGFYWMHREAESDWEERAKLFKRQATEYGMEALEIGKGLIKKGSEELKKQLEEEITK